HDAKFDFEDCNRQRFGCVVGTSKGGFQSFKKSAQQFANHPANHPDKSFPLAGLEEFPANRASVEVATTLNLQGAVLCPVAACATGLVSLMQGANLIANGYCDTVLAGSSDASLQEILLGSYNRMGVLAKNFENPQTACKPFDKTRNGFLVGEGAAMFLLEEAAFAEARGATPYAEWVTGHLATDISGLTSLEEDATSLTWLIQNCLQQAKMSPSEIDYINLHGTATRLNDIYETNALKKACGRTIYDIPCSSFKGALGHLLGAAGSVETAFSLLAMRDNIIPPTLNLTTPDPQCDLNYTPHIASSQTVNSLLKLSFGFGGHLAAAVLRAV
ncbi:3-oxoacyl-[acyl-carrier-protein] synthase, KASII, partial [hydrothermal vent metagenome]